LGGIYNEKKGPSTEKYYLKKLIMKINA